MGAHYLWFGGIWGRKDCFPGADGSTIQQSGSPNAETIAIYGADGSVLTEGSETGLQKVDITTSGVLNGNTSQVYTIKNPLTLITISASPWDWYTDNKTYQNDVLWNSSIKSYYDPCPRGWITPRDGTWNDFSIANFPYYIQGQQSISGQNYATNGRLYHRITWYPAEGCRSYLKSNFGNVGLYGYYWSSTADFENTGAQRINFNMTQISITPSAPYRANGFSIRCVQE